ncbi:MAG: RNA 2',3'-cyclic phosphodiesterase [Candidatus Pacebacteria bacterium]|nr:RNA 2',3'-cyclic phosphodiesterase [Candidatus Paceibacterota bacterium]
MRHRIFIASHLPNNVKKIFIDYQQKKLDNAYFRLVPKESLHLTLIFIGYVDSNNLLKITRVCQNATPLFSPIDVKLNKITCGPNPRSPRLIWAEGKISKDLDKLHKTLENQLIDQGINLKIENRLFRPHVTLARFKNKTKLPHLSELEESINQSFVINSISVIESELSRLGPKYTDLNTFSIN